MIPRIISTLILFLISFQITAQNSYIQELHNDYAEAKTDSAKASALGKLAAYHTDSRPDSATYYAQRGIELAQKAGNKVLEVQHIHQLGLIAETHGSFDVAKKYLKQAREIALEINYYRGIAASQSLLGVIEAKQGNLNSATELFFDALRIFKKIEDNEGIADINLKLGVVNELNENYEKAIQYYLEAQNLNKKYSRSPIGIGIYNNLGVTYAKMGNYEKALEYFKEGLAISDSLNFHMIHMSLLTNIGNTYKELGKKSESILYHRLVLEKSIKYQLPSEEARALINLASHYFDTDYNRSHSYLDSALRIAEASQQLLIVEDVYKSYVDLYTYHGLYKQALEALVTCHAISDSIYSLQKERQIAALEAEYELEESKSRIQALMLKNQKTTFQRNLGIAIGLAITVILFILWMSYRKTQMLNKQLEASNLIKDKLFSIIGHDLRGPVGGMVQIIHSLASGAISQEEQKDVIQQLKLQGEATYDVLNNLLNWGTTQLKEIVVNKVIFPPHTTVKQALNVYSDRIKEKRLDVQMDVAENLLVHASREHFDFIIRNLLSNAIKFSYEEGLIIVHAHANPVNDTIIFSVQDNGVGMSEAQVNQFMNEANIDSSYGTKGEKGTGIGLMLCKEFVEANGGKLWVESNIGKGTAFYFSFDSIEK